MPVLATILPVDLSEELQIYPDKPTMPAKFLRCKVFGHRYELIAKHHFQINEYRCSCCKKEFTDDGYGRKVPLTEYWRQNNNRFKTYLKEVYS